MKNAASILTKSLVAALAVSTLTSCVVAPRPVVAAPVVVRGPVARGPVVVRGPVVRGPVVRNYNANQR